MSEKVFGLEGDEYWTSPKKNVPQVLSARVMGRKHDLLIDAPEVVPLETRETFPVLMYYGGSRALLRRMPVEEFGMVASVNLVDNKVWADKALFRQGPKRPPEGEPEPGCTGQDYPLDLFKVVPVEPATWITTALLWDKVSNRVRTVVGNDPAGFKDAEVEKFLAAQRGAVPPKELQPQAGDPMLVSRGPGEGVPEVPAEVGISLTADRVVCLLYTSDAADE